MTKFSTFTNLKTSIKLHFFGIDCSNYGENNRFPSQILKSYKQDLQHINFK